MKYELNNIYNEDCLQAMKQIPDKYFELAIVDPPYGIGISNTGGIGTQKITEKDWDNKTPPKEYFLELKRISKNQIIFGVNYFNNIILNGGRIIWNKLGTDIGRRKVMPTFSECEIAYSSFHNNVKMFSYTYIGNVQGNNYQILWSNTERIHPTQKPVALYEWLLNNYAKKGDKILDTHLGSASSIIACKKLGFEYLGFELDPDYFKSASKRLNDFDAQLNLFGLLNNAEERIEKLRTQGVVMELKANNLQIKKSLNGDTELIFSVADKDNKIAKLISEDTTLKEFIKLKFEKWREKRSLDANAYMWVLLGKIAEHKNIKSTAEELYIKIYKNVGVYEIMPIKTIAVDAYINRWKRNGKGWFCEVLGESKLKDYTNVITYFGSSSYDTKEMTRIIEEIISDAKSLGIDALTPKQKAEMLASWEARNELQKQKAKATDIPYSVKEAVWERDNFSCIYCGNTGYGVMPNSHWISRAKGGLGIEQNIVTLCQGCHYKFDFGTAEQRSELRHFIRGYLNAKYIDWNENDLTYKRTLKDTKHFARVIYQTYYKSGTQAK